MPDPLDALRRLLGLETRPRTGVDFYGRADRAPRVPEAEMAVAEAALDGSGEIGELALRQLREAGTVYRDRPMDGSYEARITVNEPLLIKQVPRRGWQTDWITLDALDPRRELRMRVSVGWPGFAGLEGQAADGQRWPRNPRFSEESLARVRAGAPWIRFPTPEELSAQQRRAIVIIETWLGAPGIVKERHHPVTAEAPADESTIELFATEQGVLLPEAYRDLLRVANGIEIGARHILGTGDAYRFDVPGLPRLVITAPDERGAHVLAEDGRVVFIDIDDPEGPGKVRAHDLRSWVRSWLEPKRRR